MRFVLTGSFHGLNRGDSGMQLAAAAELRARYPDAEIAVHLPSAGFDRALYDDCGVVDCSRREPLRALQSLVRACAWRVTRSDGFLSPELRSYRDADIVVDLSGDGLTETFGWRCPVSHTIPLLIAHTMGKPFALLGQTIGPFRQVGPWMRWILRRAAFVGARDRETFEYLGGWGLPAPLELTADVAFLLQPGPREPAIEYLRSLGPFNPERPLLGLTPSNLFNVRTVAAGSPEAGPLATMAEAVDRFTQARNVGIAIIPHVFGPGSEYDDRIAAGRLAEALSKRNIRPLVVADPLAPRELKAVIGCCDLLVSTRMHAVIAALSQRVPVIALAYSGKHHGLLKRMEMPESVVDVDARDTSLLGTRIESTWSERHALRRKIETRLSAEIIPAAKRNFDLLESVR